MQADRAAPPAVSSSNTREPARSVLTRFHGQQIAWPEIAAITRVMSQHLPWSSTSRADFRAQSHRLSPLLRCAANATRPQDLDPARRVLCPRRRRYGQRRWIARCAECRHAIWRQALRASPPKVKCSCGSSLRQERTERLVFPRLNVPRRPPVHQTQAENMPRLRRLNWRAEAFPGPTKNLPPTHSPVAAKDRTAPVLAAWRAITARSLHRRPAHHDGRCASVIPHRHPL